MSLVVMLACIGPLARPAAGQLISPGELSEPHAELDGLRGCTSCHELRARGIEADLCLDCHAPLRARIEANAGYHAAADAKDGCARCHKEHYGRSFDLLHFEPDEFDHAEAGWEPEGAHASLDCRECHTASLVRSPEVRSFKGRHGALSRTWLGLGTECLACHESDDPHDDQFPGRTCDSCHGQDTWDDLTDFDHDATAYRLTGLHVEVECADCHPALPGAADDVFASVPASLQYSGLQYAQCSACHADEHDGGMGATCSACHVTAGWNRVSEDALRGRFDHATVFLLEGAHADAECSTCHGRTPYRTADVRVEYRPGTERRAYPSPIADGCMSCHLDEHRGEFVASAEGGECDRCHGQVDWYPARYDFRRHNEETGFVLDGAHVATPCLACHPTPELDPGGPGLQFRLGLGDACLDCHDNDDPHAGQFPGAGCDSCHGTRSFRIPDFDHDRTEYPLDGAHRDLECAACHPTETAPDGRRTTRYRPLGSECADCHGGGP